MSQLNYQSVNDPQIQGFGRMYQMKVPIPRESVTQIMNDYDCSEEQAAKAYLDDQH